jgi:hypothetical protein
MKPSAPEPRLRENSNKRKHSRALTAYGRQRVGNSGYFAEVSHG